MANERTDVDIKQDEIRGKHLFCIYLGAIGFLFVIYFILHWFVATDATQSAGLAPTIAKAETIMSAMTIDTAKAQSQLPSVKQDMHLTDSQSTQLDETYKKFEAAARQEQQNNLATELASMRTIVANANPPNTNKLTKLIDSIETENQKGQSDPAVIKVYLDNLKAESDKSANNYFWSTGWLMWLEMFLWTLFGTLLYALWEIQAWLKSEPIGEFRKQTPWYISTTVRGPFVALLILFALSTIKLDVVNIGFDLTKAPIVAWIFLAGTLGLFNRVAYKELTIISKAMFAKAWSLAEDASQVDTAKVILYEKFDIKGDSEVKFGSESNYTVEPDQKGGVTWSLDKKWAQISQKGSLVVPKADEISEAKAGAEITIVITATRNEVPKASRSKIVKLV